MEHQEDEVVNMSVNGGGVINNGGKMSATNNNNNNNSNYLCRQSSTRWTPTTEQIKLLKELYYINGVRSPTADQIQSICARLRRYGKIEGKNVFYWFQNHKARERQKKRLTPTTSTSNNNVAINIPQFHNNNNNNNNNNFVRNNGGLNWMQDHQDFSFHAGISFSSSSAGGQLMGSFNHGAVTMENKFRDCSISGVINGGNQHVSQWNTPVGTNYNPYASYSNFLNDHKILTIDEDPYMDQDHYVVESPEIETLPLFPMHKEDHDHDHDDHSFYTIKPASDGGYYTNRYQWPSNGNGGHTSLELSLNSYGYGGYSHHL